MVSTQSLATCSNSNSEVTDDNLSVSGSSTSEEDKNVELALPNKSNTEDTSFSNVAVSNSNDIRFGNETFYHGPVTIKQFLYENPDFPNNDVNDHNERNVNTKLALEDNFIPLHHVPNSKASNDEPGFMPDTNIIQDNKNVNNNVQHTEVKQDTWSIKSFWRNHIKLFVMAAVILILLIISIVCAVIFTYNKDFISREEWGAVAPKENLTQLKLPVPYVIISHCATENCTTLSTCIEIVKRVQFFHMESRNWSDIGYNFLVGGDGRVYEGRGWKPQGAHTYGYNYKSIGLSFIGTFNDYLPPERQIVAAKTLIQNGVEQGYIEKNYKLFAARQLQTTSSPGLELYKDVKTWPHWTAEPDEKNL